MSTYYQTEVDSLDEALAFCRGYQAARKACVFRGQLDSSWTLRASAFRSKDERPFDRTDQLVEWWQVQADTPPLSAEQIWQVAQEYSEEGRFNTDLLDFSRSPLVAAFFALGAPRLSDWEPPNRAALFVVDPEDFEILPTLVGRANPPLPRRLGEILGRYSGMCWGNQISGLHRLATQEGFFVRDPNGTLEATTDGRMSILPLAYEDAFGHPPLLKKVVFTPNARDRLTLERHGVTYDKLFPLPNELEAYITRFLEDSQTARWLRL